MKLEREALRHYLDYSFKGEAKTATWEVLGDDIEEMSMEMSADPYYADPSKKIYPKLREIAMKRLKGDKCKTLMLEVIVEDTSAAKHLAYVQEVMVKPQSYGGGTEGVNFPFNVLEDGTRIEGYVTSESLKTDAPVFTEGSIDSV